MKTIYYSLMLALILVFFGLWISTRELVKTVTSPVFDAGECKAGQIVAYTPRDKLKCVDPPAITYGDNSPATTGSGNTFNYGRPEAVWNGSTYTCPDGWQASGGWEIKTGKPYGGKPVICVTDSEFNR